MNLSFLGLVFGWIIAIFIALLEICLIVSIVLGTLGPKYWDAQKSKWVAKKGINLERLISDENGDASLSRFQLMIFTFVIAISLFLIIVSGKNGPAYPEQIPEGILALLGISSASYVLAKGIQASRDTGNSGSQQGGADTLPAAGTNGAHTGAQPPIPVLPNQQPGSVEGQP